MKTGFLILFFMSLTPVTGHSQITRGQDIEKEPGKEKQTELLLERREFVFRANRALPSGGSSIDLTTNPNYVKFSPDHVESYMPFFGRAYSGVGFGDTGLHFEGKPEDFIVEKKRRNYQVSATVRGERDIFRLFLTVTPKGDANLTITSNNRESISYRGGIGSPVRNEE